MFTALLNTIPLATVSSRENSKISSLFVGFIVHLIATISTLINNLKEKFIAVGKGSRTFHIYHTPPHNG
ncbi:MAG TPA: hypothetical protein VJ970_07850 [Flavobacteriaceae bacterium]|nr:hypothetical protein [Flavobacteriaceae bacterium]